MNESILNSIKKLLGITEEYTHFDADILMHINMVFMFLTQMGVGPEKGFRIEDASAVWSDYISDEENLDGVKTYIYLKVKMVFDPPVSSVIIGCMKEMINELEYRLNTEVETRENVIEEEVISNVEQSQSFAVRFRQSFPNRSKDS